MIAGYRQRLSRCTTASSLLTEDDAKVDWLISLILDKS